jgi:hypothetical protein
MALALTTITSSIASLSVSGLTILALTAIPEAVERDVPVMYPEPVDFVTDFVAELAAFNRGSTPRWNVTYNLNYTLLYAKVGSGRGMELFSPTMALAFLAVDAILAITTLSGAVTLNFNGMSTPGPLTDPAGNSFFGVQMKFQVTEFVN